MPTLTKPKTVQVRILKRIRNGELSELKAAIAKERL